MDFWKIIYEVALSVHLLQFKYEIRNMIDRLG